MFLVILFSNFLDWGGEAIGESRIFNGILLLDKSSNWKMQLFLRLETNKMFYWYKILEM